MAIDNINTAWEGHTGQEVEEFIKTTLNTKFGVIRMSSGLDENNFYSLECFASEEDAALYDTDPETYADLLAKVTIPISTVQGDAFTAMLKTPMSNTANIVVAEKKLEVPLNYRSVKITQIGNENANSVGTVIIQRKTATSEWVTVGTLQDALPSSDPTDDTSVTTIDVGEYLISGKQMLRLQAQFEYEDVDGNTKVARSGYVSAGADVTLTELRLELDTNYNAPLEAYNAESDTYNNLAINYRVYGAVNKTLVVQVKGSVATSTTNISLDATKDGVASGVSLAKNDTYGYHTHGVREVTAWLEASDGMGGTLKSEVLTNQFMVVNPTSENYVAGQKYLLLQNIKTTVTNYIQTLLCNYAVYAPSNDTETELTFQLTDTKNNAYVEVAKTVTANTKNDLLVTVEIEPEDEGNIPAEYKTRFYVFRDGDVNFIEESVLNRYGYYDVTVDNSEAIVPVLGSTFLLNPKNRENSEADPKRILNSRANDTEVESVWENFGLINDGWVTDEYGQKVLRVMAGERLTIKRNIFKQFLTTPDSAMTIDIDFRVRNVTNVDDPVIAIAGGADKGLFLNALKGWVKTESYNVPDNCMFAWREGQRQFLSLNIHNAVYPKGNECKFPSASSAQAQGSIAVARVLLNGDPVREIPFDNASVSEWCDTDSTIVIGNEGADVDVYSIRIYEKKQVDWKDLLTRNYLSSLSSTEEKMSVKAKNDLLEGDRITLGKAQAAGLNCIVYHGKRPYISETGDQAGYIEYFRYDENKTLIKDLSGTNCVGTKALSWKGQGSTAKTYYEWNMQDDNSKVKTTIQVAVKDFHESIVVGEPYTNEEDGLQYVDIYGGNLGKNFPLEDKAEAYPYNNGVVTVPDGWIDGNGKYRGMGYMVAYGTSLAQKKVAKINYASAMQSHLLGACKAYDELHYLCCGASPLQQQYIDKGLTRPVSAKHTEPFLMFWDEGDGNIYYTGLCVYGAGKMDKVTWGYVKKKHPMFAMIEGSDNNLPLTDFRVPFDDAVGYSVDEEGWNYNGAQSWDFDAGLTDDDDVPVAELRKYWSEVHNFVYLNSTNLKVYDGTASDFRNSTQANDQTSKYWCTQGDEAFHLLRYDFINGKWIDAGLKDASGEYAVINLATDIRTKATYEKYKTSSAFDEINEAFKADMARFFKTYSKLFINEKSLLFNYCFVLMFLAGTDNSSKNTYFKIDPVAQDMSANATDEFTTWYQAHFGETFDYTERYQVSLDGDDMDSILPVNNKGNLTKPYYIERLYPYSDEDPTACLYEGMHNSLFNLAELAFTYDERVSMMNSILANGSSLVSSEDNLLGLKDGKVSAWGFLHKFFFNVQYYFPQIAYIEQARIRYEFAELMGHKGARSVRPVSQSIGAQLENEQQFMEQRLVYMASFAEFGALGNGRGDVGLADAVDQLSFQVAPLPDGSPANVTLTVKPHQYIYPFGVDGQSPHPTKQRTSPKDTCVVTIATNVLQISDTTVGLRGANYYSDFGNLASVSTVTPFNVNGKRLKRFYVDGGTSDCPFRPSSLTLATEEAGAKMVSEFTFINQSAVSLAVDLSLLIRLTTVNTTGSGISSIKLPKTHTLQSVSLSDKTKEVEIVQAPNLATFALEKTDNGLSGLTKFVIGDNVATNTSLSFQEWVEYIYQQQSELASLTVKSTNWTDLPREVMDWMLTIPNLTLTGRITLKTPTASADYLSYASVLKMIARFGDVQSEANSLYVDYAKRTINSITVSGSKYIRKTGLWDGWGINIAPSTGNNVAIKDSHEAVRWYFKEGTPSHVAWTDDVKGTLNVRSLVEKQYVLVVEMTLVDGTVLTTEKSVGFYDRIPRIGDFAFADGGFDDEYDLSKTLVGCVVKIDTPVDNQYKVWVYAKENATVTSPDGSYNTASLPWGIFPVNTADEDTTYDANGFNEEIRQEIAEAAGFADISQVADLDNQNMPNIYSLGLTYTDADGNIVSTSYISDRETSKDSAFLDEDSDDGYKAFADTVAAGDFKTEAKGAIIISHANRIINGYLNEGLPTTRTELAEAMQNLVASKPDDSNPTNWRQMYYPAQYACYLYEPTIKAGETLHEAYAKGKWSLPSLGLLARIYNFFYNSCGMTDENGVTSTRVTWEKGGRLSKDYANESEEYEALLPLFANMMLRLSRVSGAGSPFTYPSGSNYWSCTEGYSANAWFVYFYTGGTWSNAKFNSHVARGVSAFTFTAQP